MTTPIVLPKNVDPVKIRLSLDPKKEGVGGEGVWVYPVEGEPNVYIMGNIPFSNNCPGLGDKFRHNQDETFEILTKVSDTIMVRYKIDDCGEDIEEIKKRYKEVYKHLESNHIQVEGAFPGFVALAISADMPEDELSGILADCPHLFLPDENGEDDGDIQEEEDDD